MVADIRAAVRAFLLADEGIAAAVGERIFPLLLPQGERRASIVYTVISELSDPTMTGPSGLSRVRMQVDCWAPSADAADALGRAVEARLDGYQGPMTGEGSPAESVAVQGAFLDDERDDYDGEADLYRASRDFIVWFEER
jgi:hypothetical protein